MHPGSCTTKIGNFSLNTFLFFYAIYGLAHVYVFFKVKYTFQLNTTADSLLALFLLFMTFSPTFVHLFSFRGHENLSRLFAYIGYIWVAIIVFFITTGILFDAYNFTLTAASFISMKNFDNLMTSATTAFFIPLVLSVTFTIYGYFEAKNLRMERLIVETPKLPNGVDKVTLVQISDLHLGIINKEKALDRVTNRIMDIKPDIIVSTGDLLDGEVNHVDYLTDRLRRLDARLGKFAVTGNHEFYGGHDHALKFLEEGGFTILRGKGIIVDGTINIAGVDDPEWDDVNNATHKSERDILLSLPHDKFTLLLKHRSDVESDAIGLFDLQLSGHTHKGQIFPINLLTIFLFHYHDGYTKLSKNSALYVSRGAGTAGPPIRFLSPPEITVIEIIRKKTDKV